MNWKKQCCHCGDYFEASSQAKQKCPRCEKKYIGRDKIILEIEEDLEKQMR